MWFSISRSGIVVHGHKGTSTLLGKRDGKRRGKGGREHQIARGTFLSTELSGMVSPAPNCPGTASRSVNQVFCAESKWNDETTTVRAPCGKGTTLFSTQRRGATLGNLDQTRRGGCFHKPRCLRHRPPKQKQTIAVGATPQANGPQKDVPDMSQGRIQAFSRTQSNARATRVPYYPCQLMRKPLRQSATS